MSSTVLFLCTGNYYRSRFAELLFNHLAAARGSPWRADSRGLATERGIFNVGPIAQDTLRHLSRCGVRCETHHRMPIQCTTDDLQRAGRVIALKEAEHRPMMVERFVDWTDRVEYWHAHDLDGATADEALSEIEALVRGLVDELDSQAKGSGEHSRRRNG